jgi:quinol-cytochrome oxidoreductase complex cytochrome b subunit
MFRVYLHGAYKHPRELNWVVGVFLLMMVLAFGFTGYLLPWNQVSFWATTIGAEIPGAFPVVGEAVTYFLKGGESVGQLALTRFFAAHVVILPWIAVGFLALHFLMVRRIGISGPL